MGYIYKITNSINDKIYIGQTVRPLEARFRQHLNDARKYAHTDKATIKLYNAMGKYGIENFSIEMVEECADDKLDEREISLINQYDSFRNGYNSTKGGSGRARLLHDDILECWENGMIVSKIVKETGHASETIINVLSENGISKKEQNKRARKSQSDKVKAPVYQYDLDGNYIRSFKSVWDVEKETGINHGCVSGVLYGAHYTAGNYQWKNYKVDKIEPTKRKSNPVAKKVYQYTKDGNYIRAHSSITSARNWVGLKGDRPIRRVCNGLAELSAGYRWSFERCSKLPPFKKRKVGE